MLVGGRRGRVDVGDLARVRRLVETGGRRVVAAVERRLPVRLDRPRGRPVVVRDPLALGGGAVRVIVVLHEHVAAVRLHHDRNSQLQWAVDEDEDHPIRAIFPSVFTLSDLLGFVV